MDYTHITFNGDTVNLRRDGRVVYRVASSRTYIIHRAESAFRAALFVRDLLASDFGYRYPAAERRAACSN